MTLLLIAAAGSVGALARYGVTIWIQSRAGGFPWGTLVVNLTGSFLLGLSFRILETWIARPDLKQALTVGFLGAFTTFSAFSLETVVLIHEGAWGRAMAYVGASVVVGVAAAALGIVCGGLYAEGRT